MPAKKSKSESARRPAVGVQFPGEGRSTSAFGRSLVAHALAGVDDAAAQMAATEKNWRHDYLGHFETLVAAGLSSPAAAHQLAEQGLAAVTREMRWVEDDGSERSLDDLAPTSGGFGQYTVQGQSEPITEFALPFGGRRLTGQELSDQLDRWVEHGSMEPSAAASVRRVAENPQWLSLPGRSLVALGAGAEMGPLRAFLGWGATVVALDLPRPAIWQRVLDAAEQGAGTLVVPTRETYEESEESEGPAPMDLGVDLLTELPAVLGWLESVDVPAPVLGNFLYADGGTNVRVAAAGHVVGQHVVATTPGTTLAFLATPTDVFAVPDEAVATSRSRWRERAGWSRAVGGVLGAASRKSLLQPNYTGATSPDLVDSLVPQQGPNYALGKRIHRWQAVAELAAGRQVSMNVAPATRTRSVTKNKALAAAYAGAHHYGVEVFEPETTTVLMAALLVHDLYGPTPQFDHPWHLEAHQATHGGLWRVAYHPRSALTLAAVLGAPGLVRKRR